MAAAAASWAPTTCIVCTDSFPASASIASVAFLVDVRSAYHDWKSGCITLVTSVRSALNIDNKLKRGSLHNVKILEFSYHLAKVEGVMLLVKSTLETNHFPGKVVAYLVLCTCSLFRHLLRHRQACRFLLQCLLLHLDLVSGVLRHQSVRWAQPEEPEESLLSFFSSEAS
ncbi:hypothetical protein ZWY2020_030139 [Hordeum vulgare]|nr:hypothetical protein ZWY2020_030139 [Hordeum vulgare]